MAVSTSKNNTTARLLGVLEYYPQTVDDLQLRLPLAKRTIQSGLHLLLGSNKIKQISIERFGCKRHAYSLIRPTGETPYRGDYKPGPLPLRYEPRETPLVTLGSITRP